MKSSASESKPFQSRSKGEIPGWARRKERLSRSKLKQAFLIDSDAELFMYLIQCIRFGSWKVRRLNRALYGYPVDFKRRQKYNTEPLDINILFQDSVYPFSFKQSNSVQVAYSLFLLLLFDCNIFEVGEDGNVWYIFSAPLRTA